MSAFLRGFSDEIEKTAGIGNLIQRIKTSPELRKAILRSTLLGAGTGALGTMVQRKDSDGKKPYVRNILGGAVGGAVTGAAFPGWFSHHSMRAADEH